MYVAGEIQRPGVYTVPTGSRVREAVERAGGLTEKADQLRVNLAQLLRDEMQVTIPPKSSRAGGPTPAAGDGAEEPVGLVNLNTATQAELEVLPGIGPSKALAII